MRVPDFGGYATKAGLECADGRTILPNAFSDQDSTRVPLVWSHGHSSATNVLGHALLEARPDGVYAYAFFNDSEHAQSAKEAVKHGDINQMSIWANQLMERGKSVLHGVIREVSLVLAGANPGAVIDPVTIKHSADPEDDEIVPDAGVIYTGEKFEHGEDFSAQFLAHGDNDDDDDDDDDDDGAVDLTDPDAVSHSAFLLHALGPDATIQDVVDSMTPEQRDVMYYIVGEALASNDTSAAHGITNQEGSDMGNRVFDKDTESQKNVLSHSQLNEIVALAKKSGTLTGAVEEYGIEHGITNIGEMFPDAKAIDDPELYGRRTEWVDVLLSGCRKSPFSRIKTLWADITGDEARAKGYITGTLKKEEFFQIAKRVTVPTTVYKKQALDRDDIVDITDYDVVTWLQAEMRIMLDEEVARAILVGDGRDPSDEDKIDEQHIRPIASDHELYTTKVRINLDDSNSTFQEVIDAVVENRYKFRGTGVPIFFTSESYIARAMLLKDTTGRRIYKNLDELAAEFRVSSIVPVEVLEDYPDIIGIMVNPRDYNIGTTKGGEVTMFDDFDIDYNKNKYLIETRMSGALVKMKAAISFLRVLGTKVVPAAPTVERNGDNLEVTIVNTSNVVYKDNANTTINNAGSPYIVTPGNTYTVNAIPASGYFVATSDDDEWKFYNSNA